MDLDAKEMADILQIEVNTKDLANRFIDEKLANDPLIERRLIEDAMDFALDEAFKLGNAQITAPVSSIAVVKKKS